jgi:hypothetical protein
MSAGLTNPVFAAPERPLFSFGGKRAAAILVKKYKLISGIFTKCQSFPGINSKKGVQLAFIF